jgi:hypothetical protein
MVYWYIPALQIANNVSHRWTIVATLYSLLALACYYSKHAFISFLHGLFKLVVALEEEEEEACLYHTMAPPPICCTWCPHTLRANHLLMAGNSYSNDSTLRRCLF